MMKISATFLSLFLLLACTKNTDQAMDNLIYIPEATNKSLTYLALGDSYTIGEAVEEKDSFPFQLVAQLKNQNVNVAAPKIIAKTGWTTSELQAAIKAENLTTKFDIVTLLIGVNNQYRGQSLTQYQKEFVALLNTAIDFADGNKKRVFVVSIPDWGVTPFGKTSARDVNTIAKEIDAFNTINKTESENLGVKYTEITQASRNALTDLTLIAGDGLHPSVKMYKEWAVKVAGAVSNAIK